MRGLIGRAIALAMLCVLGGCAAFQEVPFDKESEHISTIGLLPVDFPDRAHVTLAATVGQSFGLIGGLVDAASADARAAKFRDMAAAQNFSARGSFLGALTSVIQVKGYAIVNVEADRSGHGLLKTYPQKSAEPVDAYLDVVVVDYGYLSAGVGSAPYRPMTAVQCRLVRASDGKILMQDQIVYGGLGQPKNVISLSPDTQYAFESFRDLEEAGPTAVKGVENSLAQTADAIGNLLR